MNKSAVIYAGAMQVHSASSFAEGGNLVSGKVVQLRGKAGMKVVCEKGQLWVTQEGDPRDHVLAAAQSLELGSTGRVVLSGTPGAAYRIA